MFTIICITILAYCVMSEKMKDRITSEINAKVEDTLNEWFGVEYELVER